MVIVLLLLSLFRTFKSGNLTCQLNMQSTRTVVTSGEQDVQPRVPAIAIKLPPFWPSDPNIWFMQVEAQFTTQGINNQRTMFKYIVALSPDTATEICYLILTYCRPIYTQN